MAVFGVMSRRSNWWQKARARSAALWMLPGTTNNGIDYPDYRAGVAQAKGMLWPALSFDGNLDLSKHPVATFSATMNGEGTATCLVWVDSSGGTVVGTVFGGYYHPYHYIGIRHSNGQMSGIVSGYTFPTTGENAILCPVNSWQWVTMQWKRSTAAGVTDGYLRAKIGTGDWKYNPNYTGDNYALFVADIPSSKHSLGMVARMTGTGGLKGSVAFYGIWQGILTDSDIHDLINNGIVPASPIVCYPLTGGAGTTVYDVSGNSRHMTPEGESPSLTWTTQSMINYGAKYGVQRYLHDAGKNPDIEVPYLLSGTPINPTITGYGGTDKKYNLPAIAHGTPNLHYGWIDFSNGLDTGMPDGLVKVFFDKSNTDVHTSDRRGTYYDSAHPWRWHLSELATLNKNDYLEADYHDMFHVVVTEAADTTALGYSLMVLTREDYRLTDADRDKLDGRG